MHLSGGSQHFLAFVDLDEHWKIHSINLPTSTCELVPGTSRWLRVLNCLVIPNILSSLSLRLRPNWNRVSSEFSGCMFMGPACQVISPSFTAGSKVGRVQFCWDTVKYLHHGHFGMRSFYFILFFSLVAITKGVVNPIAKSSQRRRYRNIDRWSGNEA